MVEKIVNKLLTFFVMEVVVLIIIGVFWLRGCERQTPKDITIEELKGELDERNSQVNTALNGSLEEKKELLGSKKLNEKGLLALCIAPDPLNLSDKETRQLFDEAFKKVRLSQWHQVQVARLGEYTFNRGLLQSSVLKGEGLVEVCKNSEWMDLSNEKVQSWFQKAFKRVKMTSKEQVEIVDLHIELFDQCLLCNKRLTEQALARLDSKKSTLNLESNKIQRLLKKQYERLEKKQEQAWIKEVY